MKKCRLPFIIMLFCLIPTIVYANSSWRWISEKRPYDVLPFVIVFTLIIETLSVIFIAGVKQNKQKAFIIILIGNLLSFATPYISAATDEIYTFSQMLEHLPFYTVSFWYLAITLIIEIPIVYNGLKNNAKSKKLLLLTIIFSNILTTLMTYGAERLFCYGEW